MPVIVTEQNSRGEPAVRVGCVQSLTGVSALGHTVPEVDLPSLGYLHLATVEKSLFSMATPEVLAYLQQHNFKSIIVCGIEVGLQRDVNFQMHAPHDPNPTGPYLRAHLMS